MFKTALEQTDGGVTIGTLDGKTPDDTNLAAGWLGSYIKFGEAQIASSPDMDAADLFVVCNCSTSELPAVQKFAEAVATDRPLCLWNLELDTLRADLGLFAFPPKSLQYEFLSQFRPVFYIRQRDYSKTVNVSPFVINYSGALFREYPGPWQVMLKQDDGLLCCVAEDEKRYVLQEVKEELMTAMGLNTEEEGFDKSVRQGFKRATWWEEDEDKEAHSTWRY